MLMQKIKIILVDDEILFRKGISFLLQREENIEIIFEASNGDEIITFLNNNATHPDIILMDLRMPVINGIEATRTLNSLYPNIKIIALTSYNTQSFIANMIQLGAVGYLVKNAAPKEVIDTINEVYKKGYYYNEKVLEIINQGKLSGISIDIDPENSLSKREEEILKLVCFQHNTSEIAEKLSLSPRTVDGHRYKIMIKTKSKNIAGIIIFALQNNIITLDELVLENLSE
jgi:DNA-binding NarL/FixJ family response regulator